MQLSIVLLAVAASLAVAYPVVPMSSAVSKRWWRGCNYRRIPWCWDDEENPVGELAAAHGEDFQIEGQVNPPL
jgi:hypothetical protein